MIKVFLFLFLLVISHSGVIHLMLDRPFLPLDWEYTANGVCPLEGTFIDFLINSFLIAFVGISIIFILNIVVLKIVNFKSMKIINIIVSIILYMLFFFFLTHLDEDYCEITQMYDKYIIFYFIHSILIFIVLYFFDIKKLK